MVRYCIAIRGKPQEDGLDIRFSEREVDIGPNQEQLSEAYLLNVNPKGQVPALTSPSLRIPVIDSVKITYHIADRFPSLIPATSRKTICELIELLHTINFFALSFTDTPTLASSMQQGISQRLNGDISPSYRAALEYKMEVNKVEKSAQMTPEYIESVIDRARLVIAAVAEHFPTGSEWLLGSLQPTALDAHVVPFILRMRDVGRQELISARLMTYAERAEQTAAWQAVSQGLPMSVTAVLK